MICQLSAGHAQQQISLTTLLSPCLPVHTAIIAISSDGNLLTPPYFLLHCVFVPES